MGAPEFTIKRVSFSRLMEFENCAYATKLKVIDKIPEPERELRPGQLEHANDRGSRIHDECEMYVRGKGPMPAEAAKFFRVELESLRKNFIKGDVTLEEEWGFTVDWEPCDYNAPNVWLRMKADAVVKMGAKRILIIDYKTGRKFGNEVKHGQQLQLYALAAMILHPEVEIVDVELWYFDKDDLTHDAKSVVKWSRHLPSFDARFKKMSKARTFKPAANQMACKWCAYKGNACKFGV